MSGFLVLTTYRVQIRQLIEANVFDASIYKIQEQQLKQRERKIEPALFTISLSHFQKSVIE